MKVENLIVLTERRIAYLEASKTHAENIGDVDAVTRADTEIAEAQDTLTKLQTLS